MDPLFDKKFISSKEASDISGYHSDYLARLCREGKIIGSRVGRSWVINRDSLQNFVARQEVQNKKNAKKLAQDRQKEYRAAKNIRSAHSLSRDTKKIAAPLVFPSSFRQQMVASLVALLVLNLAVAGAHANLFSGAAKISIENIRYIGFEYVPKLAADPLETIRATHQLFGESVVTIVYDAEDLYIGGIESAGASTLAFGTFARDGMASGLGEGSAVTGWVELSNNAAYGIVSGLYGLGDAGLKGTLKTPSTIAVAYYDSVDGWVTTTSALAEAGAQKQIAFGSSLRAAHDALASAIENQFLGVVGNLALGYDTSRSAVAHTFALRLNTPRIAVEEADQLVATVSKADVPAVSAKENHTPTSSYAITSSKDTHNGVRQLSLTGTSSATERSVVASGTTASAVVAAVPTSSTTLTLTGSEEAQEGNVDPAVTLARPSDLAAAAGISDSVQSFGERTALYTYDAINSWFSRTATTLASYIEAPATKIVINFIGSQTVEQTNSVIGTPSAPAPTVATNYVYVDGVSYSYLEERLAQLRQQVSNDIYNSLDNSNYSSGGGGGSGSVSSVDASGGTTGLTFAGGPITSTGTFTLGGTLGVANGGTGLTSVPLYGELLMGDGLGGYTLVATSTLGIGAGSGSPGGANTQVQFNNAGVFAGDAGFTYNLSTDVLSVVSGLFTNATTTTFGINSETFTDLTGTGLQVVGGVLTLNATGDWTGTFDGQEGSYYLANSFSTTSADYWQTQRNFFSSTSAAYFLGQNQGLAFSTTSANYWETQQTARTADDLTNNSIEDLSDVASMTETFGDLLSWNGSSWINFATSTLGISLSDTTGTLGQSRGGTGLTSYNPGDLLYADALGNLATLGIGSAGQVLKVTGGLPQWGVDISTGGGGGAGAWATTSDSLAIYPADTSDVVIVGNSATTTANSIFEVHGRSYFSNLLGIGTTSPGAMLSVAGSAIINGAATIFGGINAPIYTATSTTATSTLPNLFTSAFRLGSDYLTDITGSGLSIVGGALTLNATGDWTGTFDGQEGSYYLANSFSTTSANYWETQQTARTADDLSNNSIEDLSDVAAMTENFGDLFYWNGSTWTDIATSSLGLQSVLAGTQGQIAYFNGTNSAIGTSSIFISSADGNVGIGTTTPGVKLEIDGTARATVFRSDTYTPLTSEGVRYYLDSSQAGYLSPTSLNFFNSNPTDVTSYSALTIRTTNNGDIALTPASSYNTLVTSGNLGVGTSSPYARLSVAGETVAQNFTATSTTATSTLPNLLATALRLGSDYLTDLTGTGLTNSGGALTLNATGDWTGTFDGQEGSYYLANSFSTTSADYWQTQRNFFSTTSANYWETQQTARTADDLTNNSIEDLSDVAAMTENYGDLLGWNGSAWVDFATSSLGLITSAIQSIGPAGQLQTGPAVTFASSTTGTDFTITAAGNAITFNLPSASATNRGLLTTSDWSLFNNKVSSTSIDTSSEVASLVTDETGSGALVFAASPTLVTPNLGTPSAVTLTNGTGLPVSTGISGLGTGVAAALGVNVGTAGSFVVNGGALGTPSSGTLTNATGLPIVAGTTGTLTVARGGTGTTTAPSGQVLYGGGAGVYQSVATTSVTIGSGLSYSGTFGSILGGASGSLSLNTTGDWTGTLDGQEGGYYLSRANHTGTQLASTISDFSSAVASYINGSSTIWKNTTEASLEAFLTDVTDVFTNNDGALSDDDLTNNSIEDLSDVAVITENYGDLLFWNGSAWADIATSSLGLITSAIQSIGPAGQLQTGPAVTFASSTTGTDFTITATGNAITFNLPSASASNRGLLTTSDWSLFNNKISSTSLDASSELASLITDETGSGALVFATSPTLVTPNLGTPSAVTLTNGTGLPISTGVSGLGTGVATALGVNIGTAGSFVVNGGALGTPSSGTLTNATGLPIIAGTTGTLTVARGGTGTTTAPSGQVLYGGGDGAYQSVATTSVTIGSGLSYSGTFGALLGGAGGTLSINTSGDWTGTFDGQEGSYYLSRANHTGTQLASTISDFDASVNSYIHASTTIPKTYSTNTFTGAQTFSNGVTIGSLNGPLQANAGVVSATTSIGVVYGGTGLTTAPTYGQLLMGNGSGGYALTATSSLGLGVSYGTDNQIPFVNAANDGFEYSSGLTYDGTTLTVTGTVNPSTSLISPIITSNNNTSASNLRVGAATSIVSQSSAATLQIAGSTNVQQRVFFNGNTATTLTANASYAGVIFGAQGATEGTSGTHGLLANVAINAPAFTNGTAATTDATTLYLSGAPTGITPTNTATALWVDTGIVRIDDTLGIGTSSPYLPLSVAGSAVVTGGTLTSSLTATSSAQIGPGGSYSNTAAISNPILTLTDSQNDIGGVTMRNSSSGSSAEFRFALEDTAGDYLAFSMGGTNNTSSVFGIQRNQQASLFLNAAGSGARTLTIGTFSNNNVVFGTNNAERMRITGAGNVGIGTTTPGSLFSIGGIANFTTATSTLYGTGGINLAGGCFAINGTCVGSSGGSGTVGSGTTGQFPYYAANGTTLSATSTLFLATTGNVGIGTSTPQQRLSVSSSGGTPLVIDGTGGGSVTTQYSSSGVSRGYWGYISSGTGGLGMVSADNNNVRLLITDAGNTGIGTTTPANKLVVVSATDGDGVWTQASGSVGTGFSMRNSSYTRVASFGIAGATDNWLVGTVAGDAVLANTQSNSLIFGTGNSERMRINSSGNVGIGSTNPSSYKLEVVGNVGLTGGGTSPRYIQIANTGNTTQFGTESSSGAGILSGSTAYATVLGSNSSVPLQFGTANTVRATFDASGNFGIGTSSPARTLDVKGLVRSSSNFGGFEALQDNGTGYRWTLANDNTFRVQYTTNSFSGVAGTPILINSSGYVGIGSTSPMSALVVSGDARANNFYIASGLTTDAGTLGFGNSNGPAIQYWGTASANAGSMVFTTAGSEKMRISNAGNVGIGTTTPLNKLVVTTSFGTNTNDGLLVVNGQGGSNLGAVGLKLKSDASGNYRGAIDAIGGGSTFEALSINVYTGYVGIGTTTPDSLLTLQFSGASTDKSYMNITAAGTTIASIGRDSNDAVFAGPFGISLKTGGGTRLKIDSSCNVGIGTTSPSQALTVAGAGTREGYPASALFTSTTDSVEGIYLGHDATNNYGVIAASRLGTAWHNIVIAPGGGNVGIGTTSPRMNLTVQTAGSAGSVSMGTWADNANYGGIYLNNRTSVGNDYNILSSFSDALYLNRQSGSAIRFREANSSTDQFTLNSGNTAIFPDGNLSVCTGGACPTGTPSGNGNLVVETAIGVASSTPWAGLSIASGKAIVAAENRIATSTSMTVDWRNGNQQLVRLGTAGTTISFSGFIEGQKLVLTVCNPGGTAGAITWGTQVLWAGGTAPTQTTTANKCDVWSFLATTATSTLKIFGTQSANF